MPDVRSVVKQMIEDGESEDVIDAVVKKLNAGSEIKSGLPDMSPELPKPPPKDEYTGPTSFASGFQKSIFGGEAIKAGLRGAKGFLKGAADIPATLADTAHGLAAGVVSLRDDPAAHFRALPEAFREMGRGMRDVTMNAGADPEAFGYMTGQIAGQPLLTEALPKLPGLARNTVGKINEIPKVNRALSATGKALEGSRDPKIIPLSPGGLVAGAVRGAVRPIGRGLSRAGERGRLAGSGVESAIDSAKRGRPNPPPPPGDTPAAQADRTTNYPILEDANSRAARNPQPSRFSEVIDASEADPMFRSDLETSADLAARTPEARTPSFNPVESDIDPMFRPTQPSIAPTPKPPKFEPSIDPATFAPDDLALLRARRAELQGALERMASGENVNTATGEIIPPTRAKNWRESDPASDFNPDDYVAGPDEPGVEFNPNDPGLANDEGIQFANSIERTFPGDEAFDLGEISPNFRSTSNMPEWGSNVPVKKAPTGVNPLRPEVPPGQLTNRQMFQNSEMRALEGRPSPDRQFADQVLPNEFAEDMLMTPAEQIPADIPRMQSPVENQFDPRITPGGVVSEGPREFAGPGETPYTANDDGVPFDLENPDINDGFIRDTERMNRAFKNRPFDQARTDQNAAWSRQQQKAALYEGRNINDIKTPPTAKQLEVQAANDRIRAWRDEDYRKFAEIEEQLPEGEVYTRPPEEKAAFDAEYARLQDERNALVERLYPNEVRALRDPLPDIDAQPVRPRPQLQGQFSDELNEEAGSFNVEDDMFGTSNDDSMAPRLVKRQEAQPQSTPKSAETPSPSKTGSWKVKGPDGKQIGTIKVTARDIADAKAMGQLDEYTDEQIGKLLYDTHLEDILEKKGISLDEPKVQVEGAASRPTVSKPAESIIPEGSEGMESLTDFSGTGREPRFAGDTPKGTNVSAAAKEPINPDKDFGPGGDIGPIAQEAARLHYDNAVDSRYRSLLPRTMRNELGPQETYKGRLQFLLDTIKAEQDVSPLQVDKYLDERTEFLNSFKDKAGIEPQTSVPNLKIKDIDLSKLSRGRINQGQPWYSPRLQQQHPDLVRRLKEADKKR